MSAIFGSDVVGKWIKIWKKRPLARTSFSKYVSRPNTNGRTVTVTHVRGFGNSANPHAAGKKRARGGRRRPAKVARHTLTAAAATTV